MPNPSIHLMPVPTWCGHYSFAYVLPMAYKSCTVTVTPHTKGITMRIQTTTQPLATYTHDVTLTVQGVAVAVWAFIKRCGRVMHAVIAVSRRHAPKWLAVLLGIALAIPGPVDELIVLAIIGVMVAVKPVMRADMVTSVRTAWMGV